MEVSFIDGARQVDVVYSTNDYSIFKKLYGNRKVMQSRKSLILQSIKERGWVRNPIVVNEALEIIDGQGRFEALKELKLPVEFVVAHGTTIDDCIALNVRQANWGHRDFIECYADLGYESYIFLREQIGKYKNLNATSISFLVGTQKSYGGTHHVLIREGRLTIADYEHTTNLLKFANQCMGLIGVDNGRASLWMCALKCIFYVQEIDNARFIARLEKHRSLLAPCANVKQALERLERIYNFGTRENKTYFIPVWDRYTLRNV